MMLEVKAENNISGRQSPSAVYSLHFSCRQAHSFTVDKVSPRVKAIQSVNGAPIAVDRPDVSTLSDFVHELVFESELNSD